VEENELSAFRCKFIALFCFAFPIHVNTHSLFTTLLRFPLAYMFIDLYFLFFCPFFSSSFPCDDLLRSALRLYHDLHDFDETCYSKYACASTLAAAARRSPVIVSLFVLIINAKLSTQYVDCLYYSRSKVNSVKYVV